MKTRVSRLHLTLLLFCVCAAAYSHQFFTPLSTAKSQDQQDEKRNDNRSPDEAAKFYLRKRLPEGPAIDSAGDLFISTIGDGRVRKVNLATGIITTVVGGGTNYPGDGGPAILAGLGNPNDLAFDSA